MRKCTLLILIFSFGCLSLSGIVFSGTYCMESLVPRETPDGWTLRSAPQTFDKETLFNHINGQADLFLQYGFQRSIFAGYKHKNGSKGRIDLDIYDMDNVVQAFGIFSRFRQDNRSAGIGLDSNQKDRHILFYKGKYFVVVRATESIPSDLKQIAKIVETRIIHGSHPPKELGYFPKKGLKPGSIEYYPQGLLGRQFLKRGFKATYSVPDTNGPKHDAEAQGPDSNLFLAIFKNPEEAVKAQQSFKELLAENGSVRQLTQAQSGLETVKGEDKYQGKLIIVLKGRYLVGATGFAQEKDAESLLAGLIASIKQ